VTKLRLVHVSDLHYRAEDNADSAIVLSALKADIERFVSEHSFKADAAIFSGDLAFSGCAECEFDGALTNALMPVASACGLNVDRVFVVPGNHDICRDTVRNYSALNEGLAAQLTSTESTNAFLERLSDDGAQEILSVGRLEAFWKFEAKQLPHQQKCAPLASTSTLDVGGKTIGLALLNSAWRATGESDDADLGKLLIGERQVDRALDQIGSVDFRIAVIHHPFDWLAPFDRQSVEPLILGRFDLACFGHMHQADPKFVATTSGSCVISQAGSLYGGRRWFNGYQFIEVDLLAGHFVFSLREYDDRHRRFGPATGLAPEGQFAIQNPQAVCTDRASQIEIFLREYRSSLREHAKQHLNLASFSGSYTDRVIDEFVAPPLYRRDIPDFAAEGRSPAERSEVSVVELLDDGKNLIIIGERKSGRTSLAFHLALELASGRCANTSIPVFVDIRNYGFKFFDLRKSVLSFYGPPPTGFRLEKSFGEGLYTFFVDNLDVYDEVLLKRFADHVKDFEHCRWIVIASPSQEGVVRDRLLTEGLPQFEKVHLGQLPRRSIRKMAKCWAEDRSADQKDTFDAVIKQITRDGLPKTPYIVALILWALTQRKAGERLNEALLLRNVIEHLLGRADFTQSARGSFNPAAKELTLQEIAWILRDRAGYIEENDLLTHLSTYFRNKRLPFSAADVAAKLISCGILHNSDGIIAFKYKAFQEYFVAQRLQNEPSLLQTVLTDLEFLKFRKELELLSGLRHKNDDLIGAIVQVLESRKPERFAKCDANEIDRLTGKGIRAGTTRAKLGEIRRKRLTDEQVDQMLDEADRRAVARGERPLSASLRDSEGDLYKAAVARESEAIDADSAETTEPLRPGTQMASIDLLARVVRNSDFSDFDVKAPAAALVLKSWTKILILMLEEIREIVRAVDWGESKPTVDDYQIMNYMMARILMSLVGQTTVDQMSSPTIAGTIAGILDELGPCTGEILLGNFILEDAGYPDWQRRWTEQIEDKDSPGFVVDAFTDRLWAIVSQKALDANQSKRVDAVIDSVEKRLGLDKSQKSLMLESIRTATNLQRAEDADVTAKKLSKR
jgi:predicted MPP superfamily phosphohydrolase